MFSRSTNLPPVCSQLGAVPREGNQPEPSSSSSVPPPPDNLRQFLEKSKILPEQVAFMDKLDISKLADTEIDPVANVSLKSSLLMYQNLLQEPEPSKAVKPAVGLSQNGSNSASSDVSVFGHVTFQPSEGKPRDTNRWQLVLGRPYRGCCDSVPVSSFCSRLISVGVRENANTVEFFRFVLANLEMSINVEVINHLTAHGVVEDSQAPARLHCLILFVRVS